METSTIAPTKFESEGLRTIILGIPRSGLRVEQVIARQQFKHLHSHNRKFRLVYMHGNGNMLVGKKSPSGIGA